MKQLDKVFERTLAQNLRGLNSTSVAANKLFGETQMQQAFIVNIDSQGYTLPDNDMAELIFKAFITSVSTYLSKVKISKEDEAVVLELTDVSGNFKFAGIVEYGTDAANEMATVVMGIFPGIAKEANLAKGTYVTFEDGLLVEATSGTAALGITLSAGSKANDLVGVSLFDAPYKVS